MWPWKAKLMLEQCNGNCKICIKLEKLNGFNMWQCGLAREAELFPLYTDNISNVHSDAIEKLKNSR